MVSIAESGRQRLAQRARHIKDRQGDGPTEAEQELRVTQQQQLLGGKKDEKCSGRRVFETQGFRRSQK